MAVNVRCIFILALPYYVPFLVAVIASEAKQSYSLATKKISAEFILSDGIRTPSFGGELAEGIPTQTATCHSYGV